MKPIVSIIIVHYKAKNELFACLDSIKKSKTKCFYEVIVIDNDEEKTIEQELSKLKWVKYIKSPKNLGFGAGNNLGAKYAKGKYIFFLNPDTVVEKGVIEKLYNFLTRDKHTGIVAPLLLDENRKPYPLQGSTELRPLEGLVTMSFLNGFLPNNPISKKYFLKDWDKKSIREVDVVPGTAFMIREAVFKRVGGFDEGFFLFFEESDLCKRVKKLGYKIFILPSAKIVHFWARSTQYRNDIKTIFTKSRFKYFQKHYGLAWALVVEFFLSINKLNLLLGAVLALALFLRLYRLNELMPFIGDQGWFYLSSRDMLLTNNIPLVGPETSHPWLHHGPLWTYTLAILLWLFHFDPIPPAYFIADLGVLTVFLLYKLSSMLFSKRTGLIAAFIYATSPLIILNARMPYHTSPIPFFTLLLFYAVYKWMKGNVYFFPLITFLIAVLYNHELTTSVLSVPIFLLVLYGFWKRKKWAIDLLSKKVITFSILLLLIPMIPFILYDIGHGYKQTVGFLVWVLYRFVKFPLNSLSIDNNSFYVVHSLVELSSYLQQLIFAQSLAISLFALFVSIGFFLYIFIRKLRNRKMNLGTMLLFLYLFVPLLALFFHRVPIEADVLLISPFIIMAIAVFVDNLIKFSLLKKLSILILLFFAFANVRFILSTNYLTINTPKNRLTISEQLVAANSIIQITKGRSYNLVGQGELSFFPVFTMPYEYLLWWKGHPPKKENVELKIVVWEKDGEITVYKK